MALGHAGVSHKLLLLPQSQSRQGLRLVKESFDLNVRVRIGGQPHELHVVVHRDVVTVHDVKSLKRLAAGIWDAGGYVNYPRSQELCIHPVLLDEVDLQLRKRMTTPGRKAKATPRRASAIGYQGE